MLHTIDLRLGISRFFFSTKTTFFLLATLLCFVPPSALGQASSEEVVYPNEKIAFICGRQLRAQSYLNPAPWFDTTALNMGITLGERMPKAPPFGPMTLNSYTGGWDNVIAGRVSINSGSIVVNGVGTTFTKDVEPGGSAPNFNGHLRIRDASGIERAVEVRSVDSDVSLTLTSPWPYGSVRDTVADTFYQQAGYNSNTESYYSDNYYDLALVQYINYYRTGDTRFLAYARKTADTWWHSQLIADGTVTGGPNHLPPRSMAFAGLMLRAMDGRPEMWDYLEREVGSTFANWVYYRKNDPTLYYDIREDGYAQIYAVLLAKVLPDNYLLYGNGTLNASTGTVTNRAAKRAQYLAQTEDTAINFFGRLQRADGSWRWDANTGSAPTDQFRDVEQPFMVGLYLESVILLHQLTSSPTVKAKLTQQLTNSLNHLYSAAYELNDPVRDMPHHRWRGMFYFWGGGSVANPTDYSPPKPRAESSTQEGGIPGARHLNSTIHHAFGYAYAITGNQLYRDMGDEVFDASYGDRVDSFHCLAGSGKGKDYAMNYRASGRYLVWRLYDPSAPNPSPTPTPTATPTPTPTATPTPSPSPSGPSLTEVVWVEDALPAGALPNRVGEPWNWVSSSPSSYSGATASQSSLADGLHQHYFYGALATMTVNSGDVLIAYVYLDPGHPPSQIMLEWVDDKGSWEHRAYWGSNNVTWGTDGTNSRRLMGPLPVAGGWTRLEVPARQVGLEGVTVNGMAFTLYAGRATWDRAGKTTQGSSLPPQILTLSGSGIGAAVALNAATLTSGEFNVRTPENFGADKQTRLMMFASGFSGGVVNASTNTSNDIIFGANPFPNSVESVVVEARTADNRIFQLPVELVGPSLQSYGVDQINVRLLAELGGAGTVELTLIVKGQRSNTATIKLI
jgi:uncharacterized protein (TIGR03437 family)